MPPETHIDDTTPEALRAAVTGPELSGGWLRATWALAAGVALLAVGGFVNSFTAVQEAVEPSFGALAWTVPVLIDLGVAVFSGIDLVLARLGMRLWWLRFVPWSGIAATIWLNVADESTSVGVVAHAAPPVLWVVGVELAAHVIRWGAGLAGDSARWRSAGRMDRVRLSPGHPARVRWAPGRRVSVRTERRSPDGCVAGRRRVLSR